MKTRRTTIRNRVMGAGLLVALAVVLVACAGGAAAPPAADQPAGDLTRANEGGAVTFLVRPLNLDSGSATLDFAIDMDTHSVDLGFDLTDMAVLKTDTGAEIAPSGYQGGSGHHVKGRLSFPASQVAGARVLTLVIRNVAGVAERTFTWQRQ